jgi:hypothetical protein
MIYVKNSAEHYTFFTYLRYEYGYMPREQYTGILIFFIHLLFASFKDTRPPSLWFFIVVFHRHISHVSFTAPPSTVLPLHVYCMEIEVSYRMTTVCDCQFLEAAT